MTTEPGSPSFDDTAIAFSSKTDRELRKASWLFRLMGNAAIVDIGSHFTRLALQMGLPVKSLVKKTIYQHFCGGESLEETPPAISRLAEQGVSTILDYGVEGVDSEEDFERNVEEQIRAIYFADGNPNVPYISCKVTGYAPFTLLERANTGQPLGPEDTAAMERLRRRLQRICEAAVSLDVAVYVDAEESWIQDTIDRLCDELMVKYNRGKPSIFTTIQLYRHDRLDFLRSCLERARDEGWILGVKLVRGAYMEKERARAAEHGYPSPIHPDKASVDADFDAATRHCLAHIDHVAFCAATHNEHSCRLLVEAARDHGVDIRHPHLHFAQLYGMSDHISFNLAKAGFNASKYVPYGPVQEVVPYLIRRARENRSIAGQVSRELRLVQEEMERRRLPPALTQEE